jgi:hypothetical protein
MISLHLVNNQVSHINIPMGQSTNKRPISFEGRINLRAKRVSQICFVAGYTCGAVVFILMCHHARTGKPKSQAGLLCFHFLFAEWVYFLAGSIMGGDVVLPFSTRDFTRRLGLPRRKYVYLYSEEFVGCFCAILPPTCIIVHRVTQDLPPPFLEMHLCLSAGNILIMFVAIVFRRILWAAVVEDRNRRRDAKQLRTVSWLQV